ncbi:MAG: PHP domain-containing protein, partial [Planctomycetota bacterium]
MRTTSEVRYAELSVTSNYTFLTGASHPEEMVRRAAELGHVSAAISDTNTLAGIVRAHVAAKDVGIPLAVGSRLALRDGPKMLVFPTTRAAYGRLCRLLTLGKRRVPKGECDLTTHDLIEHSEGLLAVVDPPRTLDGSFLEVVRGLRGVFADRLSLAMRRSYRADDEARCHQIADLGRHTGVPIVATNAVRHHAPERRPLQDVLTCIRHGSTVERAGYRLTPNAERHLKTPEEMARLFADWPGACERAAEIALRGSAFSLDELRYDYPAEPVPDGMTPAGYLRELTEGGAAKRFPCGLPARVRDSIEHELAMIGELQYEAYFLTCEEIVRFARSRGILCQGRGGAANSAVCYCLGITEVDPAGGQLLFERFISRERGEPPDIDIDFEHERREEVIQHIYQKYGRDRAGLTAEVISYRGRSAVREVGKALGLSQDMVDRLAKNLNRWGEGVNADRLQEAGVNPDDPNIRRLMVLTEQIRGFPRHLSQHVGGFVITQSRLDELVPVENAAMEDRTVIEWDKDDIDAVGMLKIDCLGLGMLTCIRKTLQLVTGQEDICEP